MQNQFSFISLGCPKNLTDSEKVIQNLLNHGYQLVQENTSEHICILNTCCFIQSATDETIQAIEELEEKKRNNIIKTIIVIGCFPSRFEIKDIQQKHPLVDHFIPIKQETQISKLLGSITQKQHPKIKLTPSHYAYLKISEGCNNHCAYCVIPKIRGTYRSFPLDTLINEAKEHLNHGAKELILIAEDTTAWGVDIYSKPSLNILLNELSKLEGLEWLRIMYAYPSKVTPELIKEIQTNPKICDYIDMPIQHVSAPILKTMNRHYTKTTLVSLLNTLKSKIENIRIRSSLIIGFPGETTKHFNEVLELIKQGYFDQLGCFTYSDEPETKSHQFSKKIDTKTQNFRLKKAMKTQYQIIQKKLKSQIGKTIKIVYEGNGFARSEYQAPDIDSQIIIINPETLTIGQFYDVKIIDFQDYELIAER